jgi:hypothetical protein
VAEAADYRGYRWLRLAVLGAVLAVVVIGAASRFHVDRMTVGDGRLYRYVAEHLDAGRSQVERDLGGHGTVLRYGRIGLPALLWTASAGRSEAMPYAQPALMVLSAAAIAAAAGELLPQASEIIALVPFLAFALLLSLTGGFAEPIALAFALWAVVLARREAWFPSAILLAGAMLTRENAGGVLLGLIAWALLHRKRRGAAILATSVIPVAAWHLAVAWRYGSLPLRDPLLHGQADNIGLPFSALGRALARSSTSADLIIVVHLVILALAIVMLRRSDVALIAAFSGLGLLVTGSFPYQYLGDALRYQTFTETAFVLAVVTELLRRRAQPDALPSTDAARG